MHAGAQTSPSRARRFTTSTLTFGGGPAARRQGQRRAGGKGWRAGAGRWQGSRAAKSRGASGRGRLCREGIEALPPCLPAGDLGNEHARAPVGPGQHDSAGGRARPPASGTRKPLLLATAGTHQHHQAGGAQYPNVDVHAFRTSAVRPVILAIRGLLSAVQWKRLGGWQGQV